MSTQGTRTQETEILRPAYGRCGLLAIALLVLAASGTTSALAGDLVRVGKASATTFAFAPIDIGKEKGIWAKYNLEVESTGFGGDARLQQAMRSEERRVGKECRESGEV